MNRKRANVFILIVLLCLCFVAAQAAPRTLALDRRGQTAGFSPAGPGVLSYQGYLVHAADSTAVTDTLEMTFKLFDAETKGNEVWIETQFVEVNKGLFHVYLGTENPFDLIVFDGNPRWLQVEIQAQILGVRQTVGWAAYSHWSWNAEKFSGLSPDDLDIRWVNEEDLNHLNAADGDPFRALFVDDEGRVGIGTQSPSHLLTLMGNDARFSIASLVEYPALILKSPIDTESEAWKLYKDLSSNKLVVQNGESAQLFIEGGSTTRVGIGKEDPDTTLEVNGGVKAKVFIGDGSQLTNISGTVDSDWNVTSGDMYSIPTGNVGIGTETPAGKLQVVSADGNSAIIAGLGSAIHGQHGSSFNEGYLGGSDYGVYGRNEMNSKYGSLGGPNEGAYGRDFVTGSYGSLGEDSSGVRGYADSGHAGYFEGDSYFSGNVGIGTKDPFSALDVIGTIRNRATTGGGELLVLVTASVAGGGHVETQGPNENPNLRLTNLAYHGNHGYVSVEDSAGNTQAAVYVDSSGDGVVQAAVKNFRIDNPAQPGTAIWYACIEGPEAAAYVRGTEHLESGKAVVFLPDHFRAVASSNGITVQLTPLSSESRGLAVVEKSVEQLVVQELNDGKGNYNFDYLVMAVRNGHEDYRVIRSASEGMPAMAAAGR